MFMMTGSEKLANAIVIIAFSCQRSLICSIFSHPPFFFESFRAMRPVAVIPITREGRKPSPMICSALNFPASQSMMVVTSPIGLHAPPAFATTTIPVTTKRSLSEEKNRLAICIMMMVTVRLSRSAERKKVRSAIRRN